MALLRQTSLMGTRGSNHAAWIVTAPEHGRSSNPRLQTLASAISRLGVFRIVCPPSQSFFSVLTEPVQANRQILSGPLRIPLSSSQFRSAEGQSWRHLRDVRRSYLASVSAGEGHEGVGGLTEAIGGAGGRGRVGGGDGEGRERAWVARDLDFLLGLLPSRWKECVTDPITPSADWVWVGTRRVRYVGEGQHALFCVLRSGRLECLEESEEEGGQGATPGSPLSSEPALVYFRSPEGPSPPGIAPWQRAEGGLWFLGTWGSLELDPTVWGIDSNTPLFRITVKAARKRMAQRRVLEECPSYRRGRALIPPTWESSSGPPTSSRGGLAALEAQWGAPRPSPSASRRRGGEFQASLDAR